MVDRILRKALAVALLFGAFAVSADPPQSSAADPQALVFVQIEASGHDILCSVNQVRMPVSSRSLPYVPLMKALGEQLQKGADQTVAIVIALDVPFEQALSARVVAEKVGYRKTRFFYLSQQGRLMVELTPGQAFETSASQSTRSLVATQMTK